MTIAVVQKTSDVYTSATAHAKAYASDVTANTLLVVGFIWEAGSGQTASIADTLTNVWSNGTKITISGGAFTAAEVFWCKANGAGANTVTVTTSAAAVANMHIWEMSGNNQTTVKDSGPQLSGAGGSNATTWRETFFTQQNNSCIFSLWGDAEQTMPSITTPTWDDSTTQLSGTNMSSSMAVKLDAGLAGGTTFTWSWGTTDDSWNIVTNAFRSAAPSASMTNVRTLSYLKYPKPRLRGKT